MVHGFRCNAKTFPMTCGKCQAVVFYFSCDCGSAVLFDKLGPPWPIHDCDASWARGLRRRTDPDGRITVRLSKYVTATRRSEFTGIESGIVTRARRMRNEAPPIVRTEPAAGLRRDVLGTLREIYRQRDPLKVLRLPDTDMARGILGPVGRQPVGQITVHAPGEETTQQESYTAFIPTEQIVDRRIGRGLGVMVDLEAVAVGASVVWFCRGLQVVA